MALTVEARNRMLDVMKTYFNSLVIIYEDKIGVSGETLPGQTLTSSASKSVSANLPLVWGTSTSGKVKTTNSIANSNELNYSILKNKTPNRMVVAKTSVDLVQAVIDLPQPLPTYTGGDGALYIRELEIELKVAS